MAHMESPPFARGETYYNGGTIDSNNLGGLNFEGEEWLFPDIQYSTPGLIGAKPSRTNRLVRCRIVRNVGAVALLPGQLVTFQKTGTDGRFYGARVDGSVCITADRCFPVDEFLPAAGVPVNDLCWIVVQGPALCLLPLAGADFGTAVTVGNLMVGLTAATSGATTAGRITNQDITGATSLLANQIQNRVGRALSAATSGNTGANVLVDVGKW